MYHRKDIGDIEAWKKREDSKISKFINLVADALLIAIVVGFAIMSTNIL